MKRIEIVYKTLEKLCLDSCKENGFVKGITASEISVKLNIHRTNASADLNKLFSEGKIEKVKAKPVLYKINPSNITVDNHDENINKDVFENIIGSGLSLRNAVQQAKAAIMYPPNGLNTLILAETGTGKSMLAETMYKYAVDIKKISHKATFITFNCADYANNQELLISQLFGVKKGAYTGADKDRKGLVEKADGGILFLDEIHRLPPQGQEMLFYLIDKGLYRKLGESEITNKAQVLIICATTEDISSALLKTFTRRIPMIIKLPSLNERTIEERYLIVKSFFSSEASSIKKDIYVSSNVMKSFLLYDCTNNIGQLKSDIKLCCARAFLESIMGENEIVYINSENLPSYIIKGLMHYKERKNEIDKYISNDYVKFHLDGISSKDEKDIKKISFYETLEQKKKLLELRGVNESDIKLIMSIDIDTYVKKYVSDINDNLEDLYKVVDKKIVDIVRDFLIEASTLLEKQFDGKILYALSMHIASSIERISNGKSIENNNIEEIRENHKKEYHISYTLKSKLKDVFNVDIPDDEIGFITMFLCMDENDNKKDGYVGVVIAMHGDSAATSLADVANRLLVTEHAVGYNMSLDEKPETAFINILEIVKEKNTGKGVVLLVDMGSLVLFGDMIYERVAIPVKVVEMVSTPMVLEATRKALLKNSLEEVYDSVVNLSPYVGRIYRESFNTKMNKNVIITACITGEGSALKLKYLIEKNFDTMEKDVDIIPIDVSSKESYDKKIQRIKSDKNVIAVVSAIKPKDQSILYISTSDFFNNEKATKLNEILNMMKIIENMQEVIQENVDIDAVKYIESIKKLYLYFTNENIHLDENTLVGLILHISCTIERVLKGEDLTHINNYDEVMEKNLDKFNTIINAVRPIELAFNTKIPASESVMIMKLVFLL